MKRKLLTVLLATMLFTTTFTGCEFYDTIPVDTTTDTLYESEDTDNPSISIPKLTQTLPVKNEKFSLSVTYDTGDYPLKDWHVTDYKCVNMDVTTKNLPEGYDVLVEHMHADISLVSTTQRINGITQDSMDNSFHGTSQDGFAIDDKTSYYRTFSIEGYTDQFYQLWGYAINGIGFSSSNYTRVTEANILYYGTYAERLIVIYDLAIKAPGEEKYHSVSVKSEILIPVAGNQYMNQSTESTETAASTEE